MPDKKQSLFDYYFDMRREWVNWKDEVKPYETPEGIKFSKILVPTVDTKKYSYILNLMVTNNQTLTSARLTSARVMVSLNRLIAVRKMAMAAKDKKSFALSTSGVNTLLTSARLFNRN